MSNIDVLSNAIKHIYETRGEEAFVNARIFHALLDDIVPTLSNERRILRSVIDDSLLKQLAFVFKADETNKQYEAIRIKKAIEDNNGLSEKWSLFIVESFMYASGSDLRLNYEKTVIANESNMIEMSIDCKYEREVVNGKMTGNSTLIKNGIKQTGYFENGSLKGTDGSANIPKNNNAKNIKQEMLIEKKESLTKELKSLGIFDVKKKSEIKKQLLDIDLKLAVNKAEETLSYLEEVKKVTNRTQIMKIDDKFSIKGRGTVLIGKLLCEKLTTGDTVIVNDKTYLVTAIEMDKKILDFAEFGDYISALIRGLESRDIDRGDYIYKEMK